MTWNHRVIRHINKFDSSMSYLAIHEVFYTNGEPDSVTESPIQIIGEEVTEMKEELEMILRCLDKPILNYADIINKGTTNLSSESRSDIE